MLGSLAQQMGVTSGSSSSSPAQLVEPCMLQDQYCHSTCEVM
jgi:hypothetical protein